ncbi:MAG TPA: porin family protein [Epsilonproteobacteria bacterium]|nr:porin family protein [Campylobacterota bacterium]
MKKVKLAILAILTISTFAIAGKNTSVVLDPVIEVPDLAKKHQSGLYLGIGISAVITYEDESSFFDPKVGQDRTGDVTLLAGYDFNPYVSVEGRYMTSFTHDERFERDLWGIYVKPQYPILDELKVYGLLGYGAYELNGKNNAIDIDENGFQWGAGVSYEVVDNISIFADYLKISNDVETNGFFTFPANISSEAVTVGMIYTF